MNDSHRILELLRCKPGLKARDIAAQLGLDRSLVNSVLYGALRGQAVQDKSYRWWPKDGTNVDARKSDRAEKLDTPLARLCRYYLDCLNYDDQGGVGVFASSFNDPSYVELDAMPLMTGNSDLVFEQAAVREFVNRTRRDRNRLTILLGYPICLNRFTSKKGADCRMIEPVFLFGLEEDPENRYVMPRFADDLPQVNFKAIRSLTASDNPGIVEEVVQLVEELGLAGTGEMPDLDELISRLRSIRPDWSWREEPDPFAVKQVPPLAGMTEAGIYNRAVLLATERSPYTKGLETELSQLQSVPEDQYRGTALGAWLRGEISPAPTPESRPLLEVLPLNTEQRQAVLQGLSNPLTAITGPPGTGKSQVVTSLLVNAAWLGKTVLFASKNNKAVDVVETRVNALGPRPILLRLGASQQRNFQQELAEYLVSLLAGAVTPEDERAHQETEAAHEKLKSRFESLDRQRDATIKLRNEVDAAEQSVEPIRSELGDEWFQFFRTFDESEPNQCLRSLRSAVACANRGRNSLLVRVLWPFLRRKRFAELWTMAEASKGALERLGITPPAQPPDDKTVNQWIALVEVTQYRIESARKIRGYFSNLERLKAATPLEELSREQRDLTGELADASEALWRSWLRLQPKRLTQEDRRLLREYASLLQMIVSSNESGAHLGREVFARYYSLFPKITGILSCWAVTSLSARGRVPFEPGFFDLLVVDEASQCDIASALPLLYRAKRAVIIGDPKQLKHISTLPEKQDMQLLPKHGLVEGFGNWAYSVNSLFDLSSGLCRSNDIVSLRDHHRSHADIIGFSNRQFYEGRLRIATRYDRLRPAQRDQAAVRWLDVRGNVTKPAGGGALNEEEARMVVRELERLVLQQGYRGSVGVVSPFRAQANRIRELVFQHHGLTDKLAASDFLADTVHRFQGDERDVMVFSPVVSAGFPSGAGIFLRNNPNLFNVAITRARAALLVIGDRQAAANSGVEYLARFAAYVGELGLREQRDQSSAASFGPEYPTVSHPELVSDWEKILYRALYQASLRTLPQYAVEQYILDFALFANGRKLNIEVDGERYHRNWDGELCRRDVIRNQRLIELGWDVMRFWVYQVRDDLDGCIERVCGWVMPAQRNTRD
ncbi:MAG: ATP-dependent RecD-like DNA helicase [Verrucomicrobiae bacterium]|nr:ATP-dependent RecD-like DNA helicase [Verrucomicrobiae bacterium]